MVALPHAQHHVGLTGALGALLERTRHRTRIAGQHAFAALLLGNAAQALLLRLGPGSIPMERVRELLPRLLGR